MPKATVQTHPLNPDGFRFYKTDNSFVDVKPGDVIELDDMPPSVRAERLAAGHVVQIPTAKPAVPAAAPPVFKK